MYRICVPRFCAGRAAARSRRSYLLAAPRTRACAQGSARLGSLRHRSAQSVSLRETSRAAVSHNLTLAGGEMRREESLSSEGNVFGRFIVLRKRRGVLVRASSCHRRCALFGRPPFPHCATRTSASAVASRLQRRPSSAVQRRRAERNGVFRYSVGMRVLGAFVAVIALAGASNPPSSPPLSPTQLIEGTWRNERGSVLVLEPPDASGLFSGTFRSGVGNADAARAFPLGG